MVTTALAKTRLTAKQVQQLSTYTDPGTILAVLEEKGWTVNRAIEELIDIIDAADTKISTKLAAVKYLNQMVVDAMERSGMMIMATKTFTGPEGEEVTFTGHMVQSNLQGPSSAQTTTKELTGEKEPEDDKEQKPKKEKSRKRKAKKSTSERGKATGTGKSGKRPESDGSPDRSTGPGEDTEAGLSDDLHTSKYPEIHLDAFQGLAVPPEPPVPGPADNDEGGIKPKLPVCNEFL